jgi:hypothetical protein
VAVKLEGRPCSGRAAGAELAATGGFVESTRLAAEAGLVEANLIVAPASRSLFSQVRGLARYFEMEARF